MHVSQFIDNWIRRPDPTTMTMKGTEIKFRYIFKYHIGQIMNVMSEIDRDCSDDVDTNPQS